MQYLWTRDFAADWMSASAEGGVWASEGVQVHFALALKDVRERLQEVGCLEGGYACSCVYLHANVQVGYACAQEEGRVQVEFECDQVIER